jgi:hypothetical protein
MHFSIGRMVWMKEARLKGVDIWMQRCKHWDVENLNELFSIFTGQLLYLGCEPINRTPKAKADLDWNVKRGATTFVSITLRLQPFNLNQGILKGSTIESCLIGLELAVWQLIFFFLFANQSNRGSTVRLVFPALTNALILPNQGDQKIWKSPIFLKVAQTVSKPKKGQNIYNKLILKP